MTLLRPNLVWCLDSPGFGGSELDFMRLFPSVAKQDAVILHGKQVSPVVTNFLCHIKMPTYSMGTGNSARHVFRNLPEATRWIRRFPHATFVIWAHHADSNRWLQVALALTHRRFIVVERIVPLDRSDFAKSRLTVPIKRFVASRATCVVLNGHSQLEHYRNLFGLHNARLLAISSSRPVEHIRETVAEYRLNPQALRRELGIPRERIALCLGRLVAQKAQTDLIMAAGLLQTWGTPLSLAVVGDGPDRAALEKLAQQVAPGRIIFVGHQDDPLPWLAAADLFVLPSLFEGLPGALIEAMAAGLPCIATDIPGNRELVRHGETGLLVPVNSPQALAEAMGRLLGDPKLAQRCARAGLELVARECDEAAEKQAWSRLFAELQGGIN